jgi:hypothetical protein
VSLAGLVPAIVVAVVLSLARIPKLGLFGVERRDLGAGLPLFRAVSESVRERTGAISLY